MTKLNRGFLPLAMLEMSNDEKISGSTRFQKLMFLVQEEDGIGDIFDFQPDKFGPFSPELAATLDGLEQRGLLDKGTSSTRAGNKKYIYELTDKGRQAVNNVVESEGETVYPVLKAMKDIHFEFGDQPLERLLRYVYSNYDEYTVKSELEL